jgi:tetratricopeptide (TPR) repeat protein
LAVFHLSSACKVFLAPLWIGVLSSQQPAPQTALDEATSALKQGRAAEADQKLDSFLKSHPEDLRALILKGAVLDSLERWGEAESYYQHALRRAPGSVRVLNNVANHYLAAGDHARAREFYLKALTIDPHHANANLQLAQMSVEERAGGQAFVYLERLGDSAASDPSVQLLRARALALAGKCSDAGPLLETLEDQASTGPALHFSVGMAFADCKQYGRAEEAFTRALKADPGNFDVLYNLGLAALEAGHSDRANGALETALHERPADADCLFALARCYLEQERLVDTAALLARARKSVPNRADVLLLLAQVTARLQFYGDAAAAYDDYLKFRPADDVARRERGFAFARSNEFKRALLDLEWYARKHPRDALGFYELGVVQCFDERAKAFQSLDRALTLDPTLVEVRYTRAVLNIEEERPAAAIDDLRSVLEREPQNDRALTRLGQAYLGLHRAADAAEVLKRAVDLAPEAATALIQYRRALEELGRTQEAAAILARLKRPGISSNGAKPQAGLIDYLSLSAAGQRERYLANLRTEITGNPGDLRLKIRLGRELLADGETAEGLAAFREVREALDPALLASSGRILLEFEQYAPAREFLEAAIAVGGPPNAARLDLAIALFHLRGPDAALTELDKIPVVQRNGDYFLLRAQTLDAQGKIPEAVEALNHGIQAAPTRASLYLQATGFLLKHKLYHEAQDLLEQATHILPDERELLLAQVVTLDLLRRNIDSDRLLAKIQARWPEWERPYLLGGILLEVQLKSAEARQTLETAIALGANTPEAFYYEALAITHAAPNDLDSAQSAIVHAMALTSKDPYIYLLGGKISIARKEYPAAIERLLEAIRLQPTLIPAHYALRDAYKALGDEQKSAAELEAIKHIASQSDTAEQSPFSMEDFLFTVRPPG